MKNLLLVTLTLGCLFIGISDGHTQRNKKKNQVTNAVTSMVSPELHSSVEWRGIGPFRGGRASAVAGVEGKPELYYMGATGGGVWRTKDYGNTWENISDGYFGGSIGAIAVSEYDPNVIYVGTGEQTVRGNVSSGNGIWKTTDGGDTWEHIGLPNSRHIGRIRVHPKNPDEVYVAAMGDLYKSHNERGVFKSIDGGKTWRKTLFANSDAGAVDLTFDPNNARILYASTWRIRRTPYSLESGGEGSALWKSTDAGETWTNISSNEGLPKGTWGINGVTVSPVNSDRVWALIENKDGGVYRSDDAGKTWKKINSERKLRQRAWYYTRLYADTQDEDILYVLNVNYHRSKDGGRTFETFNAPHGDHHDLWIAPENNQRMAIADDGGAQVSLDGGFKWSTYYNQPTAQFYRVTTDNSFPYKIYGAQQDNSTVRINHRSNGRSIGEDDWESTAGCECGHIAIHPEDTDLVYGGCYDGLIEMLDHKNGLGRRINVWPDLPMGHGAEGMKYRFQWNFPIFLSPHNPDVLYTASNHIHKSTDKGQSWEIISPDLTRNDPAKQVSSGGPITQDNTSVEYYCTVFAAAESPREKGLLWAGSDDGLIHISRDGGANWTNVTPTGLPEWMQINSIEIDPHQDGGLYFAGTKYKSGDYTPYIYKTSDYGKTWKKITNGIAREHFTRVVRADPESKGILYAGTESGAYVSYNDGQSWESLQKNLPIVPVTDLAIKNNNLIAATQGRSFWIIDDLTVIHQAKNGLNKSTSHLFKPMDSYRMGGGASSRPNLTAGKNHPGGVMTHFYLTEADMEKEIKLEYLDGSGKTIRTYSTKSKEKDEKLTAKKGGNMFSWNTVYPGAESFDGMIFWWGSLAGSQAVPGKYMVKLHIGDQVQQHDFNILKDPRTPNTVADIQAQFDFIDGINSKITEAHTVIKEVRDVRDQMDNYKKRLDKDDEEFNDLFELSNEIDSLMSIVEKELYQTKNRSRQDPLNFPVRYTNKLAHLNALTMGSDFPPTNQAVAVKNEISGKIDEQLDVYYDVKESLLPKFNDMVKQKSIDAIILKKKKSN